MIIVLTHFYQLLKLRDLVIHLKALHFSLKKEKNNERSWEFAASESCPISMKMWSGIKEIEANGGGENAPASSSKNKEEDLKLAASVEDLLQRLTTAMDG